MARSPRERAQSRRESGMFIPLPTHILQSENFQTLSPAALKLFMALLSQLEMGTGGTRNNGNLTTADAVIGHLPGLRSKSTQTIAKRELLDRGWIEQTRYGGLHMGPDLFAISFWAINDCKRELGVKPTTAPSSLWKKWKQKK